jgi:hypothetical protein
MYVNLRPPPPPLERNEITSLWVRLPAVNRHYLMGRLSQLLERQLLNAATSEEDGHESAPSK